MAPAGLVLGLALVLGGCGGGGGSGDGGLDGGDGGGTDHDPATSFLIRAPEAFELCPGFVEWRSWQEEWAMLSRLELRPVELVLPRVEGPLEVTNPVARLFLGPAREELVSPPGWVPGQATRWDSDLWHEWTYVFQVPLVRQQGSAGLEVTVRVANATGQWPAEIVLGEDLRLASLSAELALDGGGSWADQRQKYSPCLTVGEPVRRVDARTAAGIRFQAVLHQDVWWDGGCRMTGETACYYLTSAGFERGAYRTEIADRWRLVYNGSHHNWYDRYLVALEPPDGETAFVLAISPDFFTQDGAELVYLDRDFSELAREPVQTWQQ
jgi:hypothetical protein